jgi:hypothetical protein
MSPASSKKSFCAFYIFIQSVSSAWSLPGTLEGSKNCNSGETQQRPKITPNQHLSTMGELFEKLTLRTIQKLSLAFKQITA